MEPSVETREIAYRGTTRRRGSHNIERRRLIPLFDRVAETGVLLVSAGAGYGKTSALSSWAFGLDDVVVAWVDCGDEHNDPSRLAEELASRLPGTISRSPEPSTFAS